jgi:hypothetical protein
MIRPPYRSHLLQSTEWADFQRSLGKSVHRQRIGGEDITILLEPSDGPAGRVFKRAYVPYGPISALINPEYLAEIEAAAYTLGADYLRIEPLDSNQAGQLSQLGYTELPKSFQPKYTRVVTMTAGWDHVFGKFGMSNRQRWRKAQKNGLVFEVADTDADIDDFMAMVAETEKRTHTKMRSEKYFSILYSALRSAHFGQLLFASHGGERLAATIIVDDLATKTRYYLYAASHAAARKLDASTCLVAHTMQQACEMGYEYYDMFGVAPPEADQSHPWSGLSAFKASFGGEIASFGGTWEKPLRATRYKLLTTLRRLR